jgi:hypothetical protein
LQGTVTPDAGLGSNRFYEHNNMIVKCANVTCNSIVTTTKTTTATTTTTTTIITIATTTMSRVAWYA